MKKILVVYGTRPEYIKLQPIIAELDIQLIPIQVVQIGQHSSDFIGNTTHRRIPLPPNEGVTTNRLNLIISATIANLQISSDIYSHVMVHGDTATALAASIVAFNSGVPIIHVEAGLRTWDKNNPYPEEAYRQIIDKLASIHFCPRAIDLSNLEKEGIDTTNAFIVGNSVVDVLKRNEVTPNHLDTVYITLHRRENMALMPQWISSIKELAKNNDRYSFVFIRHPSNLAIDTNNSPDNLRFINPLAHNNMVHVISSVAKLFITDSGGIQEELAFYQKPSIVCRKVTERPHSGSFLCKDPASLEDAFKAAISSQININKFEFGFGNTSERIVSILSTLDMLK